MTLNVPFDQFAKTALRMTQAKDVFVSGHGSGSLVTAADPEKSLLVISYTDLVVAVAKDRLSKAGLDPHDGIWKLTDEVVTEEMASAHVYIAAVAYKSGETMPGVWVDAHATLPTQIQVLRAMFDEFRQTGELPDVSFEEFVRLSEPNVVIVAPNELQSFLDKKSDC
jgi:hypothetical protein